MTVSTQNPSKGAGAIFLVARARYENYMQSEIEPFPLVE